MLKDGHVIERTSEFRFDPSADGSPTANDPLDTAMDEMLSDPEIEALSEAEIKDQLAEFAMKVYRL